MWFAARLADVVNIIFGNTYRHLLQRTESYLAFYAIFNLKVLFGICYRLDNLYYQPCGKP